MDEEDVLGSKQALYEMLDQDDLVRLQEIFKETGERSFNIDELKDILEQFDINFSPDQLKSLFLKVLCFRTSHPKL